MSGKKKIRCAIYARTSTEEGLSQEFNSLDAQTEACRAYITSQAGEGWVAYKNVFVDGGFSGGSMDRPALQRLLTALAAHEIDVVVVYKVDRLTRSLADFAKIVERLDAAGASFVSVTQSFNTTTSMGRLTLNVLLSFAQFEREVTAERIRDKLAASKAKGMWMGGSPPLGYDVRERHLIVNDAEAERVRFIYRRYLALRSTAALIADLPTQGILSKCWTSRSGIAHQSRAITRSGLAVILSNPIYRGLIRHRDKTYPGRHEAIVDEDLWNAVQTLRAQIKAPLKRMPKRIDESLLLGKVRDDAGNTMRISHARKGERRYRYYVSTALLDETGKPGSLPRVSAGVLDRLVVDAVAPLLAPHWRSDDFIQLRVAAAVNQVEVSVHKLRITFEAEAADACAISNVSIERKGGNLTFEHPVALARPRNATTIIGAERSTARPDRTLVRAISLARHWADQLESGAVFSVVDLAAAQKRCIHYTNRLLPLAYLAPDLVELILTGRQNSALTLSAITARHLPLEWDSQRALVRRIG